MGFSYRLLQRILSPPAFLWVPVKSRWFVERQLETWHSIFWDTTYMWDGQLTEECCHKNFTLFWNYREDLSMEKRTHYKRGQTRDTLHIKKQGVGADTRRDTWALKNVCSKQETLCFWPGISNDIREAVEKCGICQASSKSSKPIGKCEWCASSCMAHTRHQSILLE